MTSNTNKITTVEKTTPKLDENGLTDVIYTKTLEEGVNAMKNAAAWYIHNVGELAFFHKDFCPFKNGEQMYREFNSHNFGTEYYRSGKFGYISIKYDGVHYFKWIFRLYNLETAQKNKTGFSASFSGKQSDKQKQSNAETEKAAFIKSAKTIDKLNLITSLFVTKTDFDDSKELTRLFISANVQSDYAKFSQDFNIISLLTADYPTDSDEKKRIQKLLTDFVKAYRNKTKDVYQSLTHSNVQICITVENDKYVVLKKFNLTIFDIIKIDSLGSLHTALEKSLLLSSQDTTSAGYVAAIIDEINRKIIAADNKPIIRNLREFKKLLYSCRGKATAKRCTYNKSNVTNFISGYVLAAYNNRLPKYTALLKPSKNK